MALGFCLFAGGYLILEDQVWPGTAAVALPTGDLIRWSFDKLHRPSKTVPVAAHDPFGSPPLPAADDPFAPDPLSQRFYDYQGICIASLAFVVGLLGATISQFLERTRIARSH
jgi:hypothetical protein